VLAGRVRANTQQPLVVTSIRPPWDPSFARGAQGHTPSEFELGTHADACGIEKALALRGVEGALKPDQVNPIARANAIDP